MRLSYLSNPDFCPVLFCVVCCVVLLIELIPLQFVVGGGVIVNDEGVVDVLPGGGGSVNDGCRDVELRDMFAIEEPMVPVDALVPSPEEFPHGLGIALAAADQLIDDPDVEAVKGCCRAIGCC